MSRETKRAAVMRRKSRSMKNDYEQGKKINENDLVRAQRQAARADKAARRAAFS
jgi:hypothetical protein